MTERLPPRVTGVVRCDPQGIVLQPYPWVSPGARWIAAVVLAFVAGLAVVVWRMSDGLGSLLAVSVAVFASLRAFSLVAEPTLIATVESRALRLERRIVGTSLRWTSAGLPFADMLGVELVVRPAPSWPGRLTLLFNPGAAAFHTCVVVRCARRSRVVWYTKHDEVAAEIAGHLAALAGCPLHDGRGGDGG